MFEPSKLAYVMMLEAPPAPPELKPWTLDHLIAWLETKPTDDGYDWQDCENCLLAQYATKYGEVPAFHTAYGTAVAHFGRAMAWHLDLLAMSGPRTFGGALQRARNLQAAQ